jgi:hypothetical protein
MVDLKSTQAQFNAAWKLFGNPYHPIIMSLTAQRDEIILNNLGGTKQQWMELSNKYFNLILQSTRDKVGNPDYYRRKYRETKEKCK